jgi:prevent-host-death family protein
MQTIAHRELRNNSAEILRGVQAGETYEVTNNGHVVARVTPVNLAPLEGIRHREPTDFESFGDVARVDPLVSVEDALDELRGDR